VYVPVGVVATQFGESLRRQFVAAVPPLASLAAHARAMAALDAGERDSRAGAVRIPPRRARLERRVRNRIVGGRIRDEYRSRNRKDRDSSRYYGAEAKRAPTARYLHHARHIPSSDARRGRSSPTPILSLAALLRNSPNE
jgi:hypothetical protein